MALNLVFVFVAALVTFVLSACASPPPLPVEHYYREVNFEAELGKELFAEVGGRIFVQGQLSFVPGLHLEQGFAGSMPGSLGIPFDFSIQSCDLALRYQTKDHLYFAAPYERADASHSALGRVIAPGDSVGVRVRKQAGTREWYVDNSVYNGVRAIWHRPVSDTDAVRFETTEVAIYDGQSSLTEIRYDGYYSNLLHFALVETQGGKTKEQEFKFDAPSPDSSTTVGIKGHVFKVIRIEPTGIAYQWLRIE